MPTETIIQKDVFMRSEGDAWYKRNKTTHSDLEAAAGRDPLLLLFRESGLTAKNILEIGASTGWRLECLRREHPRARYFGLDPSTVAVASGRSHYPELHLEVGTADTLPYSDDSMDFIVFGFCLYLCDRADLFRIAAEADRVLTQRGAIAIYDFYSLTPYRKPYTHRAGLWSYKMDYASLFTWNPAYRIETQEFFTHSGGGIAMGPETTDDNRLAVTILRRDLDSAWPSQQE